MPSFTFVSTANASRCAAAAGVRGHPRGHAEHRRIEDRGGHHGSDPGDRPVHYGGVACEMDAIGAIAERRGLMVIEDAAQGLMATYRAQPLGGIGDLGALSFHETKNVISRRGRRAAGQRRRRWSSAPRSSARRARTGGVLSRRGRQVHLGRHRLVVPASDINAAFLLGPARAGRGDHRAPPAHLDELSRSLRRSSAAAGRGGRSCRPACAHNAHMLLPAARWPRREREDFIETLRARRQCGVPLRPAALARRPAGGSAARAARCG